jgi:cbb3-type cytochrome oxidase subunit 1
VQGAVQAQMAVNQSVHFTDWVVGHSHLAMLGFATFAAAGGLVHAWQRLPDAPYHSRALEWSYWLLVAGVVLMVSDLTLAGLVEARAWGAEGAWIESVAAARPYWVARVYAGALVAAGFVALLVGLTRGPRGAGRNVVESGVGPEPVAEVSPRLGPLPSGVR